MKGIWMKEFPLAKYYYLVDKIKGEDAFWVISSIPMGAPNPEGGPYAKGSRLTLIDKNTSFHPIGSRDIFKKIF